MGLFTRVTQADVSELKRAMDALNDELQSLKRANKKRTVELVNVRSRIGRLEEFMRAVPPLIEVEQEDTGDDEELMVSMSKEDQRLRVGRQ